MRLLAVFLILAAIAGAAIAGLLSSFGHFRSIERDFAGQCVPVTGVAGPEDIVIAKQSGLAFISSLDRRADDARGAIHLFNPSDPLAAGGWQDMTGGLPEIFRPLGLSFFEDGEHRRLFVINEAVNGVELYDISENGDLVHLDTFTERRLTSPNNIVAVGPTSFYVTNDVKPGRSSLTGTLHFLTRSASGEVFFSDGIIWQQVLSGLKFANGIAMTDDGGTVYVAETAGESVWILDRDKETNALSGQRKYDIPFSPDNISVDEGGKLWVAGMPKPLGLPRHEANPDARSPSQVVMISRGEAPQSVYLDDGSELSAATAAAHIGDILLIGALYENKFLLCDLPRTQI